MHPAGRGVCGLEDQLPLVLPGSPSWAGYHGRADMMKLVDVSCFKAPQGRLIAAKVILKAAKLSGIVVTTT